MTTTEKWKAIEGYEGAYEISSFGLVRSLDRLDSEGYPRKGRLLKPAKSNRYLTVVLSAKAVVNSYRVHSLVAKAFKAYDYHEGLVVNHKDGNKENNRADNLEWCTHKHNINHAFTNGLRKSIEIDSYNSDIIQWLFDTGMTVSMIADRYDVSSKKISRVLKLRST